MIRADRADSKILDLSLFCKKAMSSFKLNGLIAEAPTPVTERGAIDFGAFLAHLDWRAEGSV